ncbi:MAG: hypothetical protein K1X94_10680 [Sandaracinaceae bacterium]|nr:hypothetical protein [Sandaracinaceae bacterium]
MRSTRVSYLGGLVLFMLGPLASSGCGFLFLDSVDGGIDAAAATEDAPSPDAPGLDAPRTDAPPISVERVRAGRLRRAQQPRRPLRQGAVS